MGDKKIGLPGQDNIKGLVQDVVEMLDERMAKLREGTPLEGVRPSDAKTFMLAARHPRTISDIAKAMNVSRQAVHKSVQRLQDRGAVSLHPAPDSRRDKIVVITQTGHDARKLVANNIAIIEQEIENRIGKVRLENLREILKDMLSQQI